MAKRNGDEDEDLQKALALLSLGEDDNFAIQQAITASLGCTTTQISYSDRTTSTQVERSTYDEISEAQKQIKLFKQLLEQNKHTINNTNNVSETALHVAIKEYIAASGSFLLNPNVNAIKKAALQLSKIELLLQYGADLNIANLQGETPLSLINSCPPLKIQPTIQKALFLSPLEQKVINITFKVNVPEKSLFKEEEKFCMWKKMWEKLNLVYVEKSDLKMLDRSIVKGYDLSNSTKIKIIDLQTDQEINLNDLQKISLSGEKPMDTDSFES